jgi:putative nucleotidyltransferase with HDIG domain
VDQLCEGLFVRLEPPPGKRLPFLRKSFKIKNRKQIEKIRDLGLTHVFCILSKSDQLPIPLEEERAPRRPARRKPEKEFKTPVSKELLGLKQETIERNKERRERFARCEKSYEDTVGHVATLLRRVSGRSQEAAEQAGKVVDSLVNTFLSQRDVVVNLMSAKPNEEKSNYHALNVTVLAMMMGKELQLDAEHMRFLGMGAMFHDIGKGRVPMSAIAKKKVTSMQYAVQKHYEQHPKLGAKIARELQDFPSQSLHIILQHHENMDGTGFPNKLPGKKISPLAKVVAVVDLYDNLLNKGAPEQNAPATPHEALKFLFTKKKQALDNRFLSLFIRTLGVYPPGSVVQLSNGLTGMVVTTNIQKATRPSVLIYHPEVPKREALIVDLAIEEELEIKRAVRPEDLPREIFSYLSPSRQVNYFADTVPEGA